MNMASFEDVVNAVYLELCKQDKKWGVSKPQSLPGFLMIIERELEEAKEGWNKDLEGKSAPLNELVQVAASCFAALQRYGLTGNTRSTDDVAVPQKEQSWVETYSRVGMNHPPL